MPKLSDVCANVRSKNAGPFWITLDLWFPDDASFQRYAAAPQHCLYFLPLPHGQGSLRPTFGSLRMVSTPRLASQKR